jgi:NitT/TauT family transport system substrate-binding protein
MRMQHVRRFSRRRFLRGVTLAGTAGLLGFRPRPVVAEPPPETTRLRLRSTPSLCLAPMYVAEELLRGEGFTEVQYVKQSIGEAERGLVSREVDLGTVFSGPFLLRLDVGAPLVMLTGMHVGCFALFGTERVRAIHDLKGKTVAVNEWGGVEHVLLASMAAYIGLDPRTDLTWDLHPPAEAMQLLAAGQIDACMAFPPFAQELRAKQIGRVVGDSAVDRPWSQYFCCIVAGNKEFVRQHPVATKRALRAILKATDLCALEPTRAAQLIVDKGYATRYDYALQTLQEVPYNRWREDDPEDTLRFYALRLHEAGMIKNTPQKLIAQGTDWRYLNQLKKELKG